MRLNFPAGIESDRAVDRKVPAAADLPYPVIAREHEGTGRGGKGAVRQCMVVGKLDHAVEQQSVRPVRNRGNVPVASIGTGVGGVLRVGAGCRGGDGRGGEAGEEEFLHDVDFGFPVPCSWFLVGKMRWKILQLMVSRRRGEHGELFNCSKNHRGRRVKVFLAGLPGGGAAGGAKK